MIAHHPPQPFSPKEKWFLLVLFLLAFAVRLLYLLEIHGSSPLFENPRLDALFHDMWAKSIAAGNFFGDEVFFRAPLYPYFLGLLYKLFGHSYIIQRLVQHMLGALAVVLVYNVSRRLSGRTAAVVASSFACFYAVLIYFEGELLLESFLTFLCTVWFLLFLRAIESPTPVRWLLAGFVYGLVCITRPTFLVVIIPLLGYALLFLLKKDTRRTKVVLVGSLLIGMSAPIIPVTIRNYVVGRDVVLIASQGGVNFYIGNNEHADGHSSSIPGLQGTSWESTEQASDVEKAAGHKVSPSEESWFWYKKGFSFIIHHPEDALALFVKKAYLFWNNTEIPNNQSFYTSSQYSFLLRTIPVGFWLVGPLGLLGMIVLWSSPTGRTFVLFMMAYFFVTIAFFVCDRFRLPVVPLLCVFSGHAIQLVWQRVRQKRTQWLALHALILVPFIFLVNSNLYPVARENRAQDFLRMGLVAIDNGDYRSAIKYCKESAKLDPDFPSVHLALGVAEWNLGNPDAAKAEFQKELERNQKSFGALVNLSRLFLEERNADSARVYGYKSIEARPRTPAGYISTVTALQTKNAMQEAESLLHAGLQMCGSNFVNGIYMLAAMELERGELMQAEGRYRIVLRDVDRVVQPRFEPEFGFGDNRFEGEKILLRSNAANGLGRVFAARERLDSATTYFRLAIQIDSTNADAWANLGVSLMRQRQFAGAELALTNATILRSDSHLYWYDLGILFGHSGRFEDATKAFEKVLELQPGFQPAKEKLALTRKLAGQK